MSENQIPLDLAREIARQDEARLSAMMELATASDLRATTLFGILGAASVGIGAAVLTLLANERQGHSFAGLVAGGTVVALTLFSGSIIAALAGAPRDFYVSGGNPDLLRNWSWSERTWRTEVEMLDATGQRYAESINRNRKTLEAISKRVNVALSLALASPILGVAVFFAVRYLPT